MAVGQQHGFYDWRSGSRELVGRLDRARSAVEDLGDALEHGDDDSAHAMAHSALDAVGSVAVTVNSLSAQRPPEARLTESDATGSMLAIGGSEVANEALDLMVNAMVALAATDDDGDDADFLIGACLDAASAYQIGATALENAPKCSGEAIQDLKRAFDRHGETGLHERLARCRARAVAINQRLGSRI